MHKREEHELTTVSCLWSQRANKKGGTTSHRTRKGSSLRPWEVCILSLHQILKDVLQFKASKGLRVTKWTKLLASHLDFKPNLRKQYLKFSEQLLKLVFLLKILIEMSFLAMLRNEYISVIDYSQDDLGKSQFQVLCLSIVRLWVQGSFLASGL